MIKRDMKLAVNPLAYSLLHSSCKTPERHVLMGYTAFPPSVPENHTCERNSTR